jgi:tetratricopeptide (TPR) repeat protein
MAKKRPRPKRESGQRRPRAEPREPFPQALRDPRAIEGVMWAGVNEAMGGPADEGPLAQAQAMAYEAFGQFDPADRVRMARQALEICPDCADAHVILAEHADGAREALAHYERGVAAGERALGPEGFREAVGHFWGILASRPYMRAREGLAHALWSAGRSDQAIDHLLEMLRLNPNDNQGIRYTLVPWLLTLERDVEVETFLQERYQDAAWNAWFTRGLIEFRRHGDTPQGRVFLRRGHKQNRFILPWLLEDEPFPVEGPSGYSLGTPEEAYLYVRGSRCAWRSTPGAIGWLRRTFEPEGSPSTASRTFRPSESDRSRIARLPGSSETWQMKFRRVPTKMRTKRGSVVPWMLMVGCPSTDRVTGQKVFTEEPGAPQLWDAIVEAFEPSPQEEPYRPATIEVRPDPRWDVLRPHLEDLGIALRESESIHWVDRVLDTIVCSILDHDPPGLMEMPRVTSNNVGSLFRTAADFYRKAPWRTLGDRYGIRVECPRFESGPWWAVVMGQAGLTLGLALYDRLDQLRDLWKSRPDQTRAVHRRITSLGLTFERECKVHPKDAFSAAKYRWEVVDPEVFPSVYRKEPGLVMRHPLSWELILLEGCLRAIPAFLAKYRPGDGARSDMTVPVATGELDVILSWIE